MLLVIGFIILIKGADVFVDGASHLARNFKISKMLIGLTIVAFGTSLPELVTSIVATKKGEYDIAIGNVVGNNIFNIGVVLGIPVAMFGNIPVGTFSFIDLGFFFLSSFLLFAFSANDYKIRKKEGIILLIMFIIYYTMILI